MKKLLIGFLLLLAASASATKEEKRVSILYMHRSVGNYFMTDCSYPTAGYPTVVNQLLNQDDTTFQPYMYNSFGDTLQVRYVFRDNNLNGPGGFGMSDTVSNGCAKYMILDFAYDQIPGYAGQFAWKIWGSGPVLGNLFTDKAWQAAENNGRAAWDVFRQHDLPTRTGGTVQEKFDMVIVKQPYSILLREGDSPTGAPLDVARINLMKSRYRALRDSVYAHPEIPCLVIDFTTPLRLGHHYTVADSNVMKLALAFCTWFTDTLIQETPYTPLRRNFFVTSVYKEMIDTTAAAGDWRYFLRQNYWAGGGDGGSHPSGIGAYVGAATLRKNIDRVTRELLKQREWRLDHASLYGGGTAAERAHADTLIALRGWIGASGDYNNYNRIKAINPDFKWMLYISGSDNYVSGAASDVEEHKFCSTLAVTDGQDPESQYLHYWDSTVVSYNWQGTTIYRHFPGLVNAGSDPTRIAASRVWTYVPSNYTTRRAKNHSTTYARSLHKKYAVSKLKALPPNSTVGYYDGVAWDNSGYRTYSTYGDIQIGGHIAEASRPGHAIPYWRADSIGTATPGWYWTQLRQFLAEIQDTFELANNWMPDQKKKMSIINYATDWPIDNSLLTLPEVAHGVSTEFNYNPVGDYGLTLIEDLVARETLLTNLGIFSKSNPEPIYWFSADGTFGRRQLYVSALAMYMTYAAPRSSFAIMRVDGTNGLGTVTRTDLDTCPSPAVTCIVPSLTSTWDTLTWFPLMNKQFGPQHKVPPTVYLSGQVDGKGQAVKIYRRDYEYATVFFRARGGTSSNGDDVDTLAAYSFALPSSLREALYDGTASSPVATTSLRPGEGRIFWNTNAIVYSPAVNISGVTLSATCNDCNNATELDNFVAAVSTGTEVNAGATIQLIYSTTGQPSVWTSPLTAAYAVSSTINIPITGVNGTEDYTLYVAVRLLKSDLSTTTPIYATIFNNNITPSLTALSVVNTASNPPGTPDQFTVTYQTPNNGTIDNVAFGYSTTSFAAITTPTQTIGFTPNFTGTVSHSGNYAEPYTLFVKGWLLENGEYTATPLQASVDVGGTPPVTTTVHKTTIKGAVRIKGNVRIK